MRMLIFAGMEEFVEKLKSLLSGDLPGPEAQSIMAPRFRFGDEHAGFQNAAVLIMLYKKDKKVFTVFIKRPQYKGVHSNQVSFPGGKTEHGDKTLHETALRETKEEIGIETENLEIIGELSPLDIPVSRIKVLPVVAYHPGFPVFHPDPAEVRYIIEAAVSDFLHPDMRQEKIKSILCKLVRVPCYYIKGNQIWGATAMILSEFIEIIRKMEPGLLR